MRNFALIQTQTSKPSIILKSIKSVIRNLFDIFRSEDQKHIPGKDDPKIDRPKVAQVAVVVSTKGTGNGGVGITKTTTTLTVYGLYTSFPYETTLKFHGGTSSYPLSGPPAVKADRSLNQTSVVFAMIGAPLSGESSSTHTDVYLDGILEADNANVPFSYTTKY